MLRFLKQRVFLHVKPVTPKRKEFDVYVCLCITKWRAGAVSLLRLNGGKIICGASSCCISVHKSHLGDFIARIKYGCDIRNKI